MGSRTIAALLCGFFYGAFFLWVVRKAEERRQADQMFVRGMERLWADLWGPDRDCVCDECCGCGDEGRGAA